MSEADLSELSLTDDRDFWVDIEVPYGKIREKWATKYEPQIRERISKGHIHKRILELYFILIGESNPPVSPEVGFDQLVEHDERIGYNLCAQHEFAFRRNPDIIKQCAREAVAGPVADTELYSVYLDAYDSVDKVTLTALIQLYDSEVLKDIIGLDYCLNKSPRTIAEKTSDVDFNPSEKVDEIIDKLSDGAYDTYSRWHSFESDGKQYVMLKREIDDFVERQIEENLEEEPAEFVVLKFEGSTLQIFSEKNAVAEKARTSINRSDPDVQFEYPSVTVDRSEANEIISGVLTGSSDLADSEVQVKGFKLSSSPFPNDPSVEMKSDSSIVETIEGLQEAGYDITESIADIDRVYLEFDGREYRVYPEEVQDESEGYEWLFRYNARHLDDEEKTKFEAQIREALGIEMILQNS